MGKQLSILRILGEVMWKGMQLTSGLMHSLDVQNEWLMLAWGWVLPSMLYWFSLLVCNLYYNHWQKSRDTFAFLGHFPIHTGPAPPLTPQTTLDASTKNFFRVLTLYRGRKNCKKISKRMHCFTREPRNYRTIWILHYYPIRTFVHDCRLDFCRYQ